eukprot:4656689-Amphidinium_carterae.1
MNDIPLSLVDELGRANPGSAGLDGAVHGPSGQQDRSLVASAAGTAVHCVACQQQYVRYHWGKED